MKIIGVDNWARETVADTLVAVGVTNQFLGKAMVDGLNGAATRPGHELTCSFPGVTFYRLVDDTYILSRGMEDFV